MAIPKQLKVTFPWGGEVVCTAVRDPDTLAYTPVLSLGVPTHATTMPLNREAVEGLRDWLTSFLLHVDADEEREDEK